MSDFSYALRDLVAALGCTPAQLADASKIPRSTLSRYLSGTRTPRPEGKVWERLRMGAERLLEKADSHSDPAKARAALDTLRSLSIDSDSFSTRLKTIFQVFDISHNQLAHALSFDPSYISRIVAGDRRPRDLGVFAREVCSYATASHPMVKTSELTAGLTGISPDTLDSVDACESALVSYLLASGRPPERSALNHFLHRLDEFDLATYLQTAATDNSVQEDMSDLPFRSTYHGVDGGKRAELDFLTLAAQAEQPSRVILYSDFPIADIAATDPDHARKIMAGMAALVRKGCMIHNIHDLHRPLNEMFLGLEGWLPAYMTGMVTPYYLPRQTNEVFLHFLRVAASVAVEGEGVAGHANEAGYLLTRDAGDLAYLHKRAEALLAHARPVMRIFRVDDASVASLLESLAQRAGEAPVEVGSQTFRNMRIQAWPGSHAVINKTNDTAVTLLVEYPPLVDAIVRYQPALHLNPQR